MMSQTCGIRPGPKLGTAFCEASAGYGDIGRHVIVQGHRPGGQTGPILPGASAAINLRLPYRWTLRGCEPCGEQGDRNGVTVAYTDLGGLFGLDPALVTFTWYLTVFDGADDLLRAEQVGEFQPVTLAQLLCGNTALAAPRCPTIPFPTREDGGSICVGSQEYENLTLVITNGNPPIFGSALSVAVWAEAAPCRPLDVCPQNADDARDIYDLLRRAAIGRLVGEDEVKVKRMVALIRASGCAAKEPCCGHCGDHGHDHDHHGHGHCEGKVL